MTKFEYPLLAKIIYRHLNLVLSPLLLAYVIISFGGIFQNSKYLIPFVVNLLLLIVFNRFYFRMYKYFPFEILTDGKKMICKNFMNKRKEIVINIADIKKIEGGVFAGSAIKPVYFYDSKSGAVIGVNPHLKDFSKFLTIVLTNIDKELYNSLVKRIKQLGDAAEELKKSRSNKKARKKRAK